MVNESRPPADEQPRHNHLTRDIKSEGQCPACDEYHRRLGVTVNDANGYPCPKDGTILTLVKGGAWCPECQTVWRELDEVPLSDLDELPTTEATDGAS